MVCDEIKEQLSAYLDDELTFWEKDTVRKHLKTCAACSRELQGLSELISATKALPLHKAPRGFTESVMGQVHRETGTNYKLAVRKFWPVAAALVIASVIYLLTLPAPETPMRSSLSALKVGESSPASAEFRRMDADAAPARELNRSEMARSQVPELAEIARVVVVSSPQPMALKERAVTFAREREWLPPQPELYAADSAILRDRLTLRLTDREFGQLEKELSKSGGKLHYFKGGAPVVAEKERRNKQAASALSDYAFMKPSHENSIQNSIGLGVPLPEAELTNDEAPVDMMLIFADPTHMDLIAAELDAASVEADGSHGE